MRRLLGVLSLLTLVAGPAAAGSMVFATAATVGRLDGFCLAGDGSFAQPATPRVQIPLDEPNPRRILFVSAAVCAGGANAGKACTAATEATDCPGGTCSDTNGGTLYVAGKEEVEAFRIGPDGRAVRHGRTEVAKRLDAHALVVDPSTRMLYVAERGFDRITAYPLDDDGLPKDRLCAGGANTGLPCTAAAEAVDCPGGTCPPLDKVCKSGPSFGKACTVATVATDCEKQCAGGVNIAKACTVAADCPGSTCQASACGEPERFTSCVQGRLSSFFANLVLRDGRMYATEEAGRVEAYGVAPDGRLCAAAGDTCTPTTPEECQATTTGTNVRATPALVERRRLFDPTSLFVIDGLLYVQEASVHRLAAFRIDELQPPPPRACNAGANAGKACTVATEATDCPGTCTSGTNVCADGTNIGGQCTVATEATACPGICGLRHECLGGANAGTVCTKANECKGSTCGTPKVCADGVNLGKTCRVKTEKTDCPDSKCGRVAPRFVSRTDPGLRYADVVLATGSTGSTFLGSQPFRGRIDAFLLEATPATPTKTCELVASDCGPLGMRCCLPKTQTVLSKADLRMSPVGMTVASTPDGMVLYVAAGDDDRIRAYRLGANGLLKTPTPFSETDAQAGSFPNDVAVAVLTSACR